MFPKINPAKTQAWKALEGHYSEMKSRHLKSLFIDDADRFSKFSIGLDDILFDYSKNHVTEETRRLLLQLAEECHLREAISAMFGGEMINATEKRSVLHTALRNFAGNPVNSGGIDVMPSVKRVLQQMEFFCKRIHSGEWKGYTGKRIRYIVNIGIGGSDLGPVMVTEALRYYKLEGIDSFFVSNIDASHIAETLKKITPDETLFLVASKTFTTQETMTNAHTARDWFIQHAKDKAHVAYISPRFPLTLRKLSILALHRKICLNSGIG